MSEEVDGEGGADRDSEVEERGRGEKGAKRRAVQALGEAGEEAAGGEGGGLVGRGGCVAPAPCPERDEEAEQRHHRPDDEPHRGVSRVMELRIHARRPVRKEQQEGQGSHGERSPDGEEAPEGGDGGTLVVVPAHLGPQSQVGNLEHRHRGARHEAGSQQPEEKGGR